MAKYKLANPDVTRLYNVTRPTFDKRLQPETSAEYQKMSDNSLDIFMKKPS